MPFHDIKQGETLIALAVTSGLESWKEILDAPENAELKKKRPDPGILLAGDKVFIPNRVMRQEPSAIDAKHPFKISRPTAWLRLAVKDANGAALAGKKYELSVDSVVTAGSVPADGVIERAVPVDASEGTLTVWIEEGKSEVWSLRIGYMDPLDETSGVEARLANLGFDCGDLDSSVRAFQERLGLEVTGTIDDALRKKLASYYDPAADEGSQEKK
jgi:N-acetylmuramoyl-L-alanine amidase